MASKKTKVNTSKFYPIEDDWNQLSDKYREKIPEGVRIYGEKVDKVYNVIDWIQDGTFENVLEKLEKDGYWLIPQYESHNFIHGLLLKSPQGSVVDKLYNRDFYPKHFEKLFGSDTGSDVKGFDPVLATVGDLLLDLRSDTTVNWDARHRGVGFISASKGGQVADNQFNNCIVIKSTAPKSIRPEKVANVYFKIKNDSAKDLTPEEKFVAEVRADDPKAVACFHAMLGARIRVQTDKLPELDEGNPITMTGISLFRSEYQGIGLGRGRHLSEVVKSLKKVKWPENVTKTYSMYLILGYCKLLQLDEDYNGDFGYDNEVMIEALRWGYEEYVGAKPKYYTTPRADGLAYPSIAYNLGRMYNRYLLSQGAAVYAGGEEDLSEKYNKGDILYVEDGGQGLNLDEYLDLPDEFKSQVGVDSSKKSSNQRDYSDLDETFNLETVVAA
tara:strand:- start:31 stop:1356 length:1326 start_codon:yes stop_codon:yes gene_type:complete